jgi:hypothetical protein
LVVESALITYVETEVGRTLVKQLQYRKHDGQNIPPKHRRDNVKNVLHKLKGDFD